MSRTGETRQVSQNKALEAMAQNLAKAQNKAPPRKTLQRKIRHDQNKTLPLRSTRWLAVSYAFRSLFSRGITRTPFGKYENGGVPSRHQETHRLVGFVMQRGAKAKDILPALQKISSAAPPQSAAHKTHQESTERVMQAITKQMTPMQLYRLHKKIEGGQLDNLRGALDFAGRQGSIEGTEGRTLYESKIMRREMRDMAHQLTRLNEMACAELRGRGYDVEERAHGYVGKQENIRKPNLQVIQSMQVIGAKNRSAGSGAWQEAGVLESHGKYLLQKDQMARKDSDGAMSSDFSQFAKRSDLSFSEKGKKLAPNLQPSSQEGSEAHQEKLLRACGGNQTQARRASLLIHAGVGRNLMNCGRNADGSLKAEKMHKVDLPEEARAKSQAQALESPASLVRNLENEDAFRFSLDRDEMGNLRVDVEGFQPIIGFVDGEGRNIAAFDSKHSVLEYRYSFTIPAAPDEPLELGDRIDYNYVLTSEQASERPQMRLSRPAKPKRAEAPPTPRMETPV